MTEHAAVIFVFFFLAEYASIALICILTSILFLGGYLLNYTSLLYLIELIDHCIYVNFPYILAPDFLFVDSFHGFFYVPYIEVSFPHILDTLDSKHGTLFNDPLWEGITYGLTLGFKACVMVFVFIWARASLPRIRYDQLMSFCWTILLPLVIALIILLPCVLYAFEIIPTNVFLL